MENQKKGIVNHLIPWFENYAKSEDNSPVQNYKLLDDARNKAQQLLTQEQDIYKQQNLKNFNNQWIHKALQVGTLKDKVAANASLCQESSVAYLNNLDKLLEFISVRKGTKSMQPLILDALMELFRDNLLPDRKLKIFDGQKNKFKELKQNVDNKTLLLWFFEDQLKKRYQIFVQSLQQISGDNVEFLKSKSMKVCYELLLSKPEQESQLLTILCNKFGDPLPKISSKSGHLLTLLLNQHPAMTYIVVSEVEKVLFRPNLPHRAHYYAVAFLNQVILSNSPTSNGTSVAQKLLKIYFNLFEMILNNIVGYKRKKEEEEKKDDNEQLDSVAQDGNKSQDSKSGKGVKSSKSNKIIKVNKSNKRNMKNQKNKKIQKKGGGKIQGQKENNVEQSSIEEVDAKMLSHLITGIRRAYPYVDTQQSEGLLDKQLQQFNRLIHTAPFTLSIQCLMLIFQMMESRGEVNDRFYRTLYSIILSPRFPQSSKSMTMLQLLQKAILKDPSQRRVHSFIKRLMQVGFHQQPNFMCAVLIMVSEASKQHSSLWPYIKTPQDPLDEDEQYKDIDDEDDFATQFAKLQQLKKAQKQKQQSKEKEHITQREDQKDTNKNGEGSKKDSKVKIENNLKEEDLGGMHSGINKFQFNFQNDMHSEDLKINDIIKEKAQNQQNDTKEWQHMHNKGIDSYDMHKRDPLFNHSHLSRLWEVSLMVASYHPSVSVMTKTLLQSKNVEQYQGNILQDLSIHNFLEKFVQKKPKGSQKLGWSVSSKAPIQFMQQEKQQPQVGSDEFALLQEQQVRVDDIFFHKFYNMQSQKNKRESRQQKRQQEREDEGIFSDDEDGSDISSEEADRFLQAEEGDEGEHNYDYHNLGEAYGMKSAKVQDSGSDVSNADAQDLQDSLLRDSEEDIYSSQEDLSQDFSSQLQEDSNEENEELQENAVFQKNESSLQVIDGGIRRQKDKKRKKSKDLMGDFASAEDYEELIEQSQMDLDKIGGTQKQKKRKIQKQR